MSAHEHNRTAHLIQSTTTDVIVVGAGPSGVASALALKDAGVRALVLDRADQVAAAWRGRYDRLRLNTSRPLSHLPDRPFAKGTPMFPTRDQLIAHIEHHAVGGGLELRFGTTVEQIVRDDGGWRVRTSNGELHAGQVIVATGYENEPVISDWPGRDAHPGTASALIAVPQPAAVSRRSRARRRTRQLRDGNRARSRARQGGQGLAGGAHAAQHPPARGPRRHPRRHDRRGDAPSPHTGRRCARALRAPDEPRRSQRVRPAGPRRQGRSPGCAVSASRPRSSIPS